MAFFFFCGRSCFEIFESKGEWKGSQSEVCQKSVYEIFLIFLHELVEVWRLKLDSWFFWQKFGLNCSDKILVLSLLRQKSPRCTRNRFFRFYVNWRSNVRALKFCGCSLYLCKLMSPHLRSVWQIIHKTLQKKKKFFGNWQYYHVSKLIVQYIYERKVFHIPLKEKLTVP